MGKKNSPAEVVTEEVLPAVQDFAHLAADRISAAADRVGPLAHQAADAVSPYAQQARDRVVDTVSPYAQQVSETVGEKVGPYAHQVSETVGPYAKSAKQRGAQVAHDAVERFGPAFEDALDKVPPAVEAAKNKMHDDVLPKLAEALAAAAAAPFVVEATDRGKAVVAEASDRGKAVVAAAKGEVAVPKPKSRWLKRLAIVVVVGGIAAIVARKLLGSSDADWQAARPTAPYVPKATAPAGPATSPASTWSAATDPTSAASANAVTAAETDDDAVATESVEDEILDEAAADQDPTELEADQDHTEPEAELGSESGEDVDPESEGDEAGELPAEDAETEGGEVSASGDTEGSSDDTR